MIELIAKLCHELNRAYCIGIGDDSQVPWHEADEWQRESAIDGVEYFMENPDATPESMHAKWCEDKVGEGWTFGEVKDAVAKTHPCLVPYSELPEHQKVKDFIFIACIKTGKNIIEQAAKSGNVPVALPTLLNYTVVKYIGKKPVFSDTLYGTSLVFTPGQSHKVITDKAVKMLKHRDVYAPGEIDEAVVVEPDPVMVETEENEDTKYLDLRDRINTMTNKKAVVDLISANFPGYRVDLEKTAKVQEYKDLAIRLIDQFGTAS